ncbi:MAG: hypothetical protein Q4D81_11815 [Eubacteriales bacterium]|nr:hypothetical protein [Eubacteriales bacterium]
MRKKSSAIGNVVKVLFVSLLCVVVLAGCGGNKYSSYASAYNKVTAAGGFDADLKVSLTMDGQTSSYTGNFKVDTVNNLMYYEMGDGNDKTIQFSDGSYVYTDQGGKKVKYALTSEGTEPAEPQKDDSMETPEFNTSEFLQDYSSFLEAGSIREMGLLDPIPQSGVTKTTKSGNVYTLQISDAVVEHFLNTMAKNQVDDGDAVQVSDLQNFTYTATVENDIVTAVTYTGTTTVNVPGSHMSDGQDASYTMDFNIAVNYNNPGSAVSVSLPDQSEYEEVSSLNNVKP